MFTNTDGLQNPHGLEEDVEHKVLENTLTLQMGLLKDQIATEENTSATMNPYTATLNLPVLDGGLDEESSEALMVCLAIAGMAILPQILGNQMESMSLSYNLQSEEAAYPAPAINKKTRALI